MEGREGALPFVDSKTRFDIPSGHGRTGRSDGSKSGHRRNQMNIPSLVIGLAAGLFIGILACILYRNKKAKDDKEKIANAEEEALRIINDAIKSAESKKREATLEAKEEILRSRKEYEKEEKERRVYDLIARRFIAVFYPDCKISTTTVMGEVDKIEFKVTGKQILEPGWRVVFAKDVKDTSEEKEEEDENVLPAFVKGESGPHVPDLNEKWTQPPRPYTEATLLRAMETAGKLVDNDELRDALKENGIGRPSTRAAIIETLFKRNYIRKERKNLIATPTGVELVQIIHEELLKSAELTGIWEKKLREIEKKTYDARQFLEELKQMVSEIVMSVLSDNTNRRITIQEAVAQTEEKAKKEPKKRERKASAPKEKKAKAEPKVPASSPSPALTPSAPASAPATGNADTFVGQPCPVCGKGTIIKGKTAYGCSEWRNGCTYRKNFE